MANLSLVLVTSPFPFLSVVSITLRSWYLNFKAHKTVSMIFSQVPRQCLVASRSANWYKIWNNGLVYRGITNGLLFECYELPTALDFASNLPIFAVALPPLSRLEYWFFIVAQTRPRPHQPGLSDNHSNGPDGTLTRSALQWSRKK